MVSLQWDATAQPTLLNVDGLVLHVFLDSVIGDEAIRVVHAWS
jgi:hypothetical protein